MIMARKQQAPIDLRRLIPLAIGVISAIVIICSLWYFVARPLDASVARLARLEQLYASLELDSSYILTRSDVFGEKRVYAEDQSRSHSSSKEYVHDGTVSATVKELRQKIEAAGFTYFNQPYKGSTFTELHFRASSGEYLRLNVSSKPRNDALSGSTTPSKKALGMDLNAAPADVIIKINLDDNNE